MINILIITICILLIITGLIGLIIPALPAVPLVFLGLLIYSIYTHFTAITISTVLILGVLTIVAFIFNYFLGMIVVKKFGATKYGIYGGLIGILVGLLFTPFGLVSIIICPILGTIIGEVISGKKISDSGKVGLGTLIGYFLGILIDITLAAVMIFVFLSALF